MGGKKTTASFVTIYQDTFRRNLTTMWQSSYKKSEGKTAESHNASLLTGCESDERVKQGGQELTWERPDSWLQRGWAPMMYISGRWIGVRASDLREGGRVQCKFKTETPVELQFLGDLWGKAGSPEGVGCVKFRQEFLHLMTCILMWENSLSHVS